MAPPLGGFTVTRFFAEDRVPGRFCLGPGTMNKYERFRELLVSLVHRLCLLSVAIRACNLKEECAEIVAAL